MNASWSMSGMNMLCWLLSALFCLVCGIAFALDIVPPTFATFDVDVTIAILAAGFPLCILLRKLARGPNLTGAIHKGEYRLT
jgi:hypothetical protein